MFLLIRHGQASFGEQDYDRLSRLGEQQARILGDWFAQQGTQIDAIYSGLKKRQIDTASLLHTQFTEHTGKQPLFTPNSLESFNEIDAERIFEHYLELNRHTFSDEINQQLALPKQYPGLFQQYFKVAINLWLDGELNVAGVQSWPEFQLQIITTIRELEERHARNENVLIVTSGGPISAASSYFSGQLQRDGLIWRVPNTGLISLEHSANEGAQDAAAPLLASNFSNSRFATAKPLKAQASLSFETPHLSEEHISFF